MHIHRFAIDEAERRPARGVLHHWRGFLTIRRSEDGPQLFGGHVETILQQPKSEFSLRSPQPSRTPPMWTHDPTRTRRRKNR